MLGRKMKKITAALFVLLFIIGCSKEDKIEPIQDIFTVELGDEIDKDIETYFQITKTQLEDATIDFDEVKPLEVGEYTITLTYKEDEYTTIIQIVDTTAPVAITKDLTVTQGDKVDASMLIEKVEELTDYTVSFKEEYVFDEVKTYEVVIVVMDTAGNKNEYQSKVTVNAIVKQPAPTNQNTPTNTNNNPAVNTGPNTVNQEMKKQAPSAVISDSDIKNYILNRRPSVYTDLKAFHVYGESINLYGNNYVASSNDTYTGKMIELKDVSNQEVKYKTTASRQIDKNIQSYQIPVGVYEVYIDGKRLKSSISIYEELYTITRNGKNKQVVLYANKNMYDLSLENNEVFIYVKEAPLPADVYDVLIDPGHSAQTTTGDAYSVGAVGKDNLSPRLTEIEQNVSAGLKLKAHLEAAGLKVTITRPSASTVMADYGIGSRIHMSYQTHAKLFISSHLNGNDNSSHRGYEIYTSLHTSSELGDKIVAEVNAGKSITGITSAKQIKRPLAGDTKFDYYFVTRETGGHATMATQKKGEVKSGVANESFGNVARGAQGVLLEYIFLSNANDCAIWRNYQDQLVQQNANGILKYLGIK